MRKKKNSISRFEKHKLFLPLYIFDGKGYATDILNPPDIFTANAQTPLKLVAYQKDEIMCLFLTEKEDDSSFYSDLEMLISKHTDFLPFLEENFNSKKQRCEKKKKNGDQKKNSLIDCILSHSFLLSHRVTCRFEEQYRYLYFNHQNFALKTSISERGSVLPKEIMKMLNDMHSDFERFGRRKIIKKNIYGGGKI